MERSAEFWRGADWQWVHDARRVDIAEELADAEAREAGKRDYLGEARQAAIELANKLAQQEIAAAEVIAAAEKALARYANGPWLVVPNEGFSAKDGSTRKRFAAFEDQGGEIAKEALAEIAQWKEAKHGK